MSKRVLIIEDDPEDQFLLHKILFKNGVENVESLSSAEDATRYIAGLFPYDNRQVPKIIFLEMKMKGIDGLDLIRWIKRNSIFAEIPLIAFSSSIDPDEQAKAIDLGASAFYLKTQIHDELPTILAKVLRA